MFKIIIMLTKFSLIHEGHFDKAFPVKKIPVSLVVCLLYTCNNIIMYSSVSIACDTMCVYCL